MDKKIRIAYEREPSYSVSPVIEVYDNGRMIMYLGLSNDGSDIIFVNGENEESLLFHHSLVTKRLTSVDGLEGVARKLDVDVKLLNDLADFEKKLEKETPDFRIPILD